MVESVGDPQGNLMLIPFSLVNPVCHWWFLTAFGGFLF